MMTTQALLQLTAERNPVPERYRGVWRRELLQTPDERDSTSTVFWLQTRHWHADIRIPDKRPSFSGIESLESCDAKQLAWLATQQGFAGITQVEQHAGKEVCTWHRVVDFQPPGIAPDAGHMEFNHDMLLETGVHGSYFEEWHRMPGSNDGTMVLARSDADGTPTPVLNLLLVAGNYVMRIKSRAACWPDDIAPGTALSELISAGHRQWLDFEISFGRRTMQGWTVLHSTLPYLEGRTIPMRLEWTEDTDTCFTKKGGDNVWRVLEWHRP